MGKSYWWDDGPCDFSVSPSPNWTFGFWTALVFGLGLGLGGLEFGLGLDNIPVLGLDIVEGLDSPLFKGAKEIPF